MHITKAIAYTLLINGELVAASDSAPFDSFNPTTGEIWATVPETTESDVNRAVKLLTELSNKARNLQCRQPSAGITCAALQLFWLQSLKTKGQPIPKIRASC